MGRLKALFGELVDLLEQLNPDTFEADFPSLLSKAKESRLLEDGLVREYGKEKMLALDPEIAVKAKLIENKYDNIIGTFSVEEEVLRKRLTSLNSEKKLVNYKRYQYANQRTF